MPGPWLEHPDAPIPVKKSIIGIASILLGLMMGGIAVLSWRLLGRRINDPHWIEKVWDIKMLSNIPHSKKQHSQSKQFRQNKIKNLNYFTNFHLKRMYYSDFLQ